MSGNLNLNWVVCDCNNCSGHLEFDPANSGETVQCPHCGIDTVLFIKTHALKPRRKAVWIAGGIVVAVILCIWACLSWQHRAQRVRADIPHLPLAVLQDDAAKGNPKAQIALALRYYNGQGVATNWVEAANWWRKAAAQGDTNAQVSLGIMYRDGEGVEKNPNEAFKWFTKAADQGDGWAQRLLGMMYRDGVGVEKDIKAAVGWFIKAAEQGYDRDILEEMYLNGEWSDRNAQELLFTWTLKSANQGDADAQSAVAEAYDQGLRVAQNKTEAAKWYKMAFETRRKEAEKGDASAQWWLGFRYRAGEGMEKNANEAVKWFTKAAEQGNKSAQKYLAEMYRDGEGIAKNPKEAIKWFTKAANQGDVVAQLELASWGFEYVLNRYLGNGEALQKEVEESLFKWLLKSAERGDANEQCAVAQAYEKGLGTTQNGTEALNWYYKAAQQDDVSARFRLGEMFRDGDGVVKDPQMAFKWFEAAAQSYLKKRAKGIAENPDKQEWKAYEQLAASAEYKVAEAYETGVGVLQDKQAAFTWFRKAAYHGHKFAQAKVGLRFYQRGDVAENRVEAQKWLSLAALQGVETAVEARDKIAKMMTTKELAEAKRRAEAFITGETDGTTP